MIASKIIFLGVIMAIGFLSEKTGFTKGLSSAVSQVLTRITLPLLVITTLSGQVRSAETWHTAVAVFIFGLLFVFLLLFLGKISAIPFHFNKKRADVHICLTSFGNTIFLAYPLLRVLWGETAVFYAAFFSIANDLAAWTIGVLILSHGKNGRIDFRRLINPTTLSYVIGAVMFAFSLRLPPFLHEAAAEIGSTTTVLSMLFLGAVLAGMRFRELFEGLSSITIIVIKMIGVPIAAFYFLRWLIPALDLPIHTLVPYILAMELAMPCQSVFAILSREYGGDTDYAATAICLTTAASLVTLPFVYTLLS
ncbi:MAG: AEC family transporter [Clostridia bacterium]|nr:AEC family transporter [Clostridia bacterium]